MNTTDDLRAEFERLVADAPDAAAVRDDIRRLAARTTRRRRALALVAVAASVVVIAGGAVVTSSLLRDRDEQAAAPQAGVVAVPEVPIPEGSDLIRHELGPVTTPVTATPPEGLTALSWTAEPGWLSVSWHDPRAEGYPTDRWEEGRAAGEVVPQVAGYLVTDERDAVFTDNERGGRVAVTPQRERITIAGHDATLETAPFPANDVRGLPADARIVWQLADGRWIQVWFQDVAELETPREELRAFAETIVERPQALARSLGIGLTLPGLDVDWSTNTTRIADNDAVSLFLCPEGVDPFAPSYGAAAGSGSADAGGAVTRTEASASPAAGCLSVTALSYLAISAERQDGHEVTVEGLTVTVAPKQGSASYVRGDGLFVVVGAPAGAGLSADGLAALAASVRVGPQVEVAGVSDGVSPGSSDSTGAVDSAPASDGVSEGGASAGEADAGDSEASQDSASGTATAPPAAAATAPTLARGPNSSPPPPETLATGLIDGPGTAAVTWSVDQTDRTARLVFALSNTSDDDVWLKEVTTEPVPGMTQVGPAAEEVLYLPPLGTVTVSVTLTVDDCSALTAARTGDPAVTLLFFRGTVWWATHVDIDDGGFLRAVTQALCG